jgi:putative transposase
LSACYEVAAFEHPVGSKCPPYEIRSGGFGIGRVGNLPTVRRPNIPHAVGSHYTAAMPNYRRSLVPGATYFFTIALADRASKLLTGEIGKFRAAYRATQAAHPFDTIAICVLPEHLHAIWRLPEDDCDYALRWRLIKSRFSAGLPVQPRGSSQAAKREKGIWQRRYWEHQIRDEDDLIRHVDYIYYNPVKHGWVQQVKDWRHSSFHRWVLRGDLSASWASVAAPDGVFGE